MGFLRSYREKNNLSQKEMAKKLNTTQSQISKMENKDLYKLSFEDIIKISIKTDTSVVFLFDIAKNDLHRKGKL